VQVVRVAPVVAARRRGTGRVPEERGEVRKRDCVRVCAADNVYVAGTRLLGEQRRDQPPFSGSVPPASTRRSATGPATTKLRSACAVSCSAPPPTTARP